MFAAVLYLLEQNDLSDTSSFLFLTIYGIKSISQVSLAQLMASLVMN